MQINITGHQMEITDALRQRVEERVSRLSDYTNSVIGNTHVVLEVNKQQHLCSIIVNVDGDNLSAKDNSDNMYSAIERATDKICRQIEKLKNRQKEARRH